MITIQGAGAKTPESFDFTNLSISKSGNDMSAHLYGLVKYSDGTEAPVSAVYTGSDFRTFWQNFNSLSFLYQEIAEHADLSIQINTSSINSIISQQQDPV